MLLKDGAQEPVATNNLRDGTLEGAPGFLRSVGVLGVLEVDEVVGQLAEEGRDLLSQGGRVHFNIDAEPLGAAVLEPLLRLSPRPPNKKNIYVGAIGTL